MAGRSLESELQTYKKHAQLFVQLAKNKTGSCTASQQAQLQERVELAKKSVIG